MPTTALATLLGPGSQSPVPALVTSHSAPPESWAQEEENKILPSCCEPTASEAIGFEEGRGHRVAGEELMGTRMGSAALLHTFLLGQPMQARPTPASSGTTSTGGQETRPLSWLCHQFVRDWASTPPPLGLNFFLCKGVTDVRVLLQGPRAAEAAHVTCPAPRK